MVRALVWVSCFIVGHCHVLIPQSSEEEGFPSILSLFSGLDIILNYFRNNSDPLAQKILHTFEQECFFTSEPKMPSPDDPSRRPYVVIEGNNRASRDRVGVPLARIMDGRYFNNPAPCLIKYLEQLQSGSLLRRAYFILSLYATDFNVRVQIAAGRPVVVNGCWLDQLVFALEKTYDELPEATADIFNWPPDLLQPDITFFLASGLRFRSHSFVSQRSNIHHNRTLEMYRRLQRRFPIMILDNNAKPDIIFKHMTRILSHRRDLRSKDADVETEIRLQLFTGLEGILSFFRNNSNVLAQRILETFETECMYNITKPIPGEGTRKPFIVVEGNGHNSRDVIGKALARKMNARYMVHPASCLVKYMDVMPKASVLRRAYYILSLYAMSHSIKAHLSTNKAVVLNGYWHDQLTFSLAQLSKPDNPIDPTADQFRMPDELLPPDLIVYLLADDQQRITDKSAPPTIHECTLEMYKSLQSLYPIVIEELTGDPRSTTANVFRHIQERLSDTRHIVQQDFEEVSEVLHLFTGLTPVLDFFRKSTHPFSKEILSQFQKHWTTDEDGETVSRKPFIVIEGNNRTSRDIIAYRLTKMLDGVVMKHPATCLRDFMYTLPSGSLLRRAYYQLSLYATSQDIRRLTKSTTVIVNGFWLDQLTFALIQSFQYGRLPKVTTPIYRWPRELLMPDIIFYLNHPDHLEKRPFTTRSHNNWKPRSLELYRKLSKLYNISIIDVQMDFSDTAKQIYDVVQRNYIHSNTTEEITT